MDLPLGAVHISPLDFRAGNRIHPSVRQAAGGTGIAFGGDSGLQAKLSVDDGVLSMGFFCPACRFLAIYDVKRPDMRTASREKRREALVQCDKTATVVDGQPQQVSSGDLSVAQKETGWRCVIQKGDVVFPERVALQFDDFAQEGQGFVGCDGLGNDLWIG